MITRAKAIAAVSAPRLKSPARALRQLSAVIWRNPLTRNGYALAASIGISSGLGLLFWVMAARLYSAKEVGLATAFLAVLLTLGNISQLAFGNLLNRFLPVAGKHTFKIIIYSYLAAASLSTVLAASFIAVASKIAHPLSELLDNPFEIVWLVASTALWTIFALQDSVLAGLRKSSWVVVKNTIYACVKLVLLIPFTWSLIFRSGIFAAWTIPVPFIVIGINWLIFRRIIPHGGLSQKAAPEISFPAIARFFGWDYFGTLTLALISSSVPLLILDLAGPVATAVYNLSYTISFSFYLIGRAMSSSLLTESAVDMPKIEALAADALVHMLIVLVPIVVVVVGVAPFIMSLFGPEYVVAGGAGLLRLLALSCIPWSLVTIYLSVARCRGHLIQIAVVQIATGLLALTFGIPLTLAAGGFGMGIAWLLAHSFVVLGLFAFVWARHGASAIIEGLLGLANALARLRFWSGGSHQAVTHNETDARLLQSLLDQVNEPGLGSLSPLPSPSSLSGVRTILLGDPPDNVRLVYKVATTTRGIASLRLSVEQVQRIRSCAAFAPQQFWIPEILASGEDSDRFYLIERALPGRDGREVFLNPVTRAAAVRSSLLAIASLYAQTRKPAVIGPDWFRLWIEEPAGLLALPPGVLMPANRRRKAIDNFVMQQKLFWLGRAMHLGLAHGDFSPGNILFATGSDDGKISSRDASASQDAAVCVSAIIDWETVRWDAPGAFDAYYLLLTTRALDQGRELGQVLSRMLLRPGWTAQEQNWLDEATGKDTESWSTDPHAIRALTGLVWLRHVAANLEKSERYMHNRLWTAWNVEKVLQVFLDTSSA